VKAALPAFIRREFKQGTCFILVLAPSSLETAILSNGGTKQVQPVQPHSGRAASCFITVAAWQDSSGAVVGPAPQT